MKNKNLLIITGLIVLLVTLMSMTKGEKTYEYMYIIQNDVNLKIVKPGNFIEVREEKITAHRGADYRKALEKLQEMESQGWELYSNTIDVSNGYSQNYFLMRKSK